MSDWFGLLYVFCSVRFDYRPEIENHFAELGWELECAGQISGRQALPATQSSTKLSTYQLPSPD